MRTEQLVEDLARLGARHAGHARVQAQRARAVAAINIVSCGRVGIRIIVALRCAALLQRLQHSMMA